MTINYTTPTDDFVKTIDVMKLLPQKEPFIMIDSLVHFDMQTTISETRISPKNIFVEQNAFSASGLMENIAQTCAARIGYINKYILKKGIQIGLIGAIKNFEILALPLVGSTIKTIITVKEEIFGMILVEAVIECENRIIANTEMKIAVTEEEVK